MADPRAAAIESFFRDSQKTMQAAADDRELQATVLAISDRIAKCFRDGGKVLLAGNGGSAADAQHIAAEFVVRYTFDRAPLPAIALTTDTSALTAAGNDYGYERVFERQLRALGRPGDVFIGFTTSGKSPNVLAALKAAREMGVTTVGFTGTVGATMKSVCDLVLIAPSSVTAQIQQIHITAGHAICGIVERDLFKEPSK
jgi:D-sedoheptulose 7-phosphate isomerase